MFLSGMLPTEGHEAKFIGRLGAELDVDARRKAARLAELMVYGVASLPLGTPVELEVMFEVAGEQ